jgi:hypothetical protein
MNTTAELREQIQFWSERTDISDDQIDNFIMLVEQNYKQDFFLPPNETIVTLTTDVNGEIAIPSDYLKMKSCYVLDVNGNKKPIYRKPNEFVVVGSDLTSVGTVSYFERSGSSFIFAPSAGEGVDITMTYYSIIPSLLDIETVNANAINFVMSVMPTVYLFGALMFLHMYTFNEERANYYATLYQTAKDDLVGMQSEAEMSGSSLHVVPTLSDDGSTW